MGELRQQILRTPDRVPPSFPPPRSVSIAVDGERETAGFLDELYAAAVEHSRLAPALAKFAEAFDAAEACLFVAEQSAGRDQVAIIERSGSIGLSPRDDRPSVSGLVLTQELAAKLAGRLGVWRGLVRGAGHYMALASSAEGEPLAGIVALRDFAFTDFELEAARLLLPDIRRALNLRRHAGRAEALGLGVQLFDLNPVAIFITRQRTVERSNAAALSLLTAGRPVALVAGKLHFDDARVHSAFELVSRADAHAQGNRAFAFVVEGAEGRTWIAQLSPARAAQGVVVALTPFNAASQARETMLNGFTDLTPTERTIFAAFVDGQDIAAIAARLNRSVETVRWHVRNLFTKLGVNSQADLARLGALLLPI
jgi:DNA-binding NarL/FixJ family response regulator